VTSDPANAQFVIVDAVVAMMIAACGEDKERQLQMHEEWTRRMVEAAE
jgi:hypothetical protein